MKNELPHTDKVRKVVVNIARIVLALTLIFSGFVKAVDPLGTQYKLADYLTAMQLGRLVPDFVTLGASVLLSAFEFVVGVCLLFAIRRRLMSMLALIAMLVMTPLTVWLAIANPISDCGCFGDAIVRRWPLDMVRFISRTNQWIVVNYTMIFILVVSGWSLYDRPMFDFRPYHIGTNLKAGWQQMMEGKESHYADFFMESIPEGEDITEKALTRPGYLFLLVSPHLEQADDSQLDLINQVYEYAVDNGYPFCQTDDIVLKTIIRSNPGLLLLKDGVVIRKWSHNRLPDEYQLSGKLEKLEIGRMPEDSTASKILAIILWYVLPLLLLTIADRLWAWTRWLKRVKKVKSEESEELKA